MNTRCGDESATSVKAATEGFDDVGRQFPLLEPRHRTRGWPFIYYATGKLPAVRTRVRFSKWHSLTGHGLIQEAFLFRRHSQETAESLQRPERTLNVAIIFVKKHSKRPSSTTYAELSTRATVQKFYQPAGAIERKIKRTLIFFFALNYTK